MYYSYVLREGTLLGSRKVAKSPNYLTHSAMPNRLECEFTDEMLRLYSVTDEAIGSWPTRYLEKIKVVGGLKAAQDALKPTNAIAPSLRRLAKEYRLDLSLEDVVLQEPWRDLFTAAELGVARERLAVVRKTQSLRTS